MSDEEIADALDKFADYLNVGSIFSDPFRMIGWILVKGFSFILDGLESVTDDVLLVKTFFQNDEVQAFVTSIRPLLYILLAFSILYAGYMLIFQKKFDREGMAINLFIAMSVIALIGTGMNKANDFTDDAIDAIGTQQLYGEEEGTISQNILSRNITDLTEFDDEDWETTDIERPNTIPLNMIERVSITEKFDKSRKELKMSKDGKDISKYQVLWMNGERDLAKLDQSGLEWNNEYYYRYNLDWISLITTLIVMSFTLISITFKLAKLSFELAFNYILANIIAPTDIHDGQKTKKILQSILNTFLVIILIFLSMKIYVIGTSWITDELSGMAYLITLIAFSVAVIDGPNIVERLFGIDAGLKSGWGMVAGGIATAKIAGGLTKGVGNTAKKANTTGKDGKGEDGENKPKNKGSNSSESKALSPNDNENNNSKGKGEKSNKQEKEDEKTDNQDKDKKTKSEKSPSPNDSVEGKPIGSTAPSPNDSGEGKPKGTTGSTAPSPNDSGEGKSKGTMGSTAPSPNDSGEGKPTGTMGSTAPSPNDSVDEGTTESTSTSGGSANKRSSQKSSMPKPTSANDMASGKGSNEINKNKSQQKSTIQNDTDIDHVVDEVEGTQNVNTKTTGGTSGKVDVNPTNSNNSNSSRSSGGTNRTEKSKETHNSTVRQDVDVENQVDHVRGNVNNTERVNRNNNNESRSQPRRYRTGDIKRKKIHKRK